MFKHYPDVRAFVESLRNKRDDYVQQLHSAKLKADPSRRDKAAEILWGSTRDLNRNVIIAESYLYNVIPASIKDPLDLEKAIDKIFAEDIAEMQSLQTKAARSIPSR